MELPLIYSVNQLYLTQLSAQIINRYQEAGKRLALVESCTGGLATALISAVPGSSTVLDRGWVLYSNASKVETLGLSEDILKVHGAVSAPCAVELARIGLGLSKADVCLSITGIAGPGGGTKEKPVGTVFMALAVTRESPEVMEFSFEGDRAQVRAQAIAAAFRHLLEVGWPGGA